MTEVDAWRVQVWELLSRFDMPLQVLVLLAAFTFGLMSVRSLD